MRKMPNGNLSFLLDVGQEGTFVVHAEGKDAVLVRGWEFCAEGCEVAVRGGGGGVEGKAVERREHAEFEL
jgi:hypothetical protein